MNFLLIFSPKNEVSAKRAVDTIIRLKFEFFEKKIQSADKQGLVEFKNSDFFAL